MVLPPLTFFPGVDDGCLDVLNTHAVLDNDGGLLFF